MKKIILQEIRIDNFKGSKKITIPFNTDITRIRGENGTGKTRIMDAFMWGLFGKDSWNRKDFDIKNTLNREKNRGEHIVEIVLYVNNSEITLKRIYKEKWQKKRGEEETEYTGNQTDYGINEVPVSQAEYQKRVNEICDEQTFKLITNPTYFNSLKWDERRSILFSIADCPKDMTIAESNDKFKPIAQILEKENLDNYKKMIASKKKNIKDVLDLIPARIDEVQKSLLPVLDWKKIEADIKSKDKTVSELDAKIENENKAYTELISQNNAIYKKINELTAELRKIESDIKNNANKDVEKRAEEISKAKSRQRIISQDIEDRKQQLGQLELNIDNTQKEIAGLRELWNKENEKELTFNEHEFTCPACKREFEASDIEAKKAELTTNFNKSKLEKLDNITKQGKQLNQTLQSNKDAFEILKNEINVLQNTTVIIPEVIEAKAVDFKDYEEWINKSMEIEAENQKIKIVPEATEFKTQKTNIICEINELRQKLSAREQIEKANNRIENLKQEENKLAQELSNFEKWEFLIAEFNKFKIQSIEDKINSMFKTCRWQMFNTLVNGGEEPCCNCLVDGVDFNSNLNTGARILTGIEICDVIGKYYQIGGPVFIDNYESLTSCPKSESQIILLEAKEGIKELTLE